MNTPRTSPTPSTSTSAVRVAANGDVDELKERLAALDALGHDDHAGTGAEHRHPGTCPLPDRFDEAIELGEPSDRRGLPARDDERLHLGQLVGGANLHGSPAGVGQHEPVLAEVTLQRENPDLHGTSLARARYQPRV